MKWSRLTIITIVLIFSLPKLFYSQIIQGEVAYSLSSGVFDGTTLTQPTNLFSSIISQPDAKWLRIKFSSANLGKNSYLIIRSIEDGLWQKLNSESIEQWNFSSAYFNGSSVEISLFVGPGDREIYFSASNLLVGEGIIQTDDLCGADDRVQSNHKAVGRIVKSNLDPWGTGWILYDGRIVSAGHVVDGQSGLIIEFNVPTSNSNGTPRHPGPEDQYSVNHQAIIYHNDGPNDDGEFVAI